MYNSQDYKLMRIMLKKTHILAAHFVIPERWVKIMYCDSGFTVVKTLGNDRMYWVKMSGKLGTGNKIVSVAPVV